MPHCHWNYYLSTCILFLHVLYIYPVIWLRYLSYHGNSNVHPSHLHGSIGWVLSINQECLLMPITYYHISYIKPSFYVNNICSTAINVWTLIAIIIIADIYLKLFWSMYKIIKANYSYQEIKYFEFWFKDMTSEIINIHLNLYVIRICPFVDILIFLGIVINVVKHDGAKKMLKCLHISWLF